jgi:hypothetical protein
MKAHHPASVVFECLLLLAALLVAANWIARAFFYRYTPSPEHESVFLRDYSPRPVIQTFAVPYSIEVGSGVSSSAGSKFVTNERTVDPSFAIQADLCPSFVAAMSDDLSAQLIQAGATIVAKTVGPQGEYRLSYRDGTNAGSVVSFPLTDAPGQSTLTTGNRKVRAHIVISEKWFPKELDAIRATTQ